MKEYRLSNEAKNDLARIYWYGGEAFGELQAERYFNLLIDRFSEIAKNPYKYPTVDYIRKDYRRSVCGVDSIYFRIQENVVEIMRVLGRQDVDLE